jgi:hypothetical protein
MAGGSTARSLRLRDMSRSGFARAARAAVGATLTSRRLRLFSDQVGRAGPADPVGH